MKQHISELIKIAYEHDELRSDLVPLIQGEIKLARSTFDVSFDIEKQMKTENFLCDFSFIAHIKREHALDRYIHPETELENTINTIVEKARDGDEFAIELIAGFWEDYEGGEEELTSEELDKIREQFDNLDLTDFRQGKAVEKFCSLVGKSMTMGSWTGRKTLIGELVDDTLWSLESETYGPIIKAVRKLHKGIDKDGDGKLSREEIVKYVKLAGSRQIDLDLQDAETAGMAAALLKKALEEVLISALTAKMKIGKGLGKKVVVKVIEKILGSILDKSGLNDQIDELTDSAVSYVSDKLDVVSGKVGIDGVGSKMKVRSEASALVPSKINAKYKDKVTKLASSVGETPSASDLHDIANQTMTLAEQYFTEGAAEIDEAIKNSLVYKNKEKITPKFVQKTLMKLGDEKESEVDKYVLEKMQNTDNHTGVVLSYLQQQVCTMMAELQMAESVGPLAQDIYEKFLSKLGNKEERDAILDMIKEQK